MRGLATGWARARVGLSAAGFLISGYLAAIHYFTAVKLVCPANGIVNCAQVLHSPQSVVLGLPLGIWGMVWFLVMGVLAVRAGRAAEAGGDAVLPRRVWAGVGAVAVVYFVYLELLVIHYICIWCTSVHILVLALFVLEAAGVE